jgi:hypothetical protein
MIAPGRASPVTSSSRSSRLVRGNHAGDSKAAEAIRDLVETVTVFREPPRPGGVTVEIAGRLNALLGGAGIPPTRFTALLSEAGAAWADTACGAAPILNWLVEEKCIAPHIPVNDKSKREDGTFSRGDFRYDPTNDIYHCAPGKALTRCECPANQKMVLSHNHNDSYARRGISWG